MELNIVRKKIRKGTLRIAYVYPGPYEFMVSSLSSHIIYYMLNTLYDEVYVERFHVKNLYGPEPLPRSLETGSPLRDYELIITSLHYEPAIASLVRILYYGGVDPRRKNRETLVIAGGPAVMSNPHPYTSVVDAFIIGEAENTLPRVIDAWITYRGDKKRFLEEIASYRYVYVPEASSERIHREWVGDLNNSFYPIKQFWDPEREPVFGKGFILETSRGCRFWCRFCVEGRLFKPYRSRNYDVLKKLLEKGLEATGVDRVSIYSLVFPSSSDERRIVEYLVENNVKASFPSMRINYLNQDLLYLIREAGQRTLTIAPENFNPLIQRVIGKYSLIDTVFNGIYSVIEAGFDLKLYLIYGFKDLENIDVIRENIDSLKKIVRKAREKGVRISLSINPLTPKPHTVFQWIGMIELERARRILNTYRRELRGLVDTRPLDINWAWVQAAIGLADRNIGEVLVEWGIEGGDLGSWRRVLRRRGYNTSYVFKGYSFGENLPWSNIVVYEGLDKFLEKEYSFIRELTGRYSV